jgi:DNA-binding protein H-NS
MTTLAELLEQQKALEAQINLIRAAERNKALEQIHSHIEQHKLAPADVFPPVVRTKSTSNRAKNTEPKYRDPATGKTWVGKGRIPLWLPTDEEAHVSLS